MVVDNSLPVVCISRWPVYDFLVGDDEFPDVAADHFRFDIDRCEFFAAVD